MTDFEKKVDEIQMEYPSGTKIKVLSTSYKSIKYCEGIVDFVDDTGQMFVILDNGKKRIVLPTEKVIKLQPVNKNCEKLFNNYNHAFLSNLADTKCANIEGCGNCPLYYKKEFCLKNEAKSYLHNLGYNC